MDQTDIRPETAAATDTDATRDTAADADTSGARATVAGAETVKATIMEALHNVYDPELGVNIVDLGLVYGVDLRADGFVTVTMTLTTPGCPMHESIGMGVSAALEPIEGVTGGDIRIVWEPRWDPSMLTEAGREALGFW